MKMFACTSCMKRYMYLEILMILYSDSCSSGSLSFSFLFSCPQPLYIWQPFACKRPLRMVSGVFPRRAFRTHPRVAQDQPVLPYRLWAPVWIHLTPWTKNWSDSVYAAVVVFPLRAFWMYQWTNLYCPMCYGRQCEIAYHHKLKNQSDSVNAAVMVFPWRAFVMFPWAIQNQPVPSYGLWLPVWIHLTLWT